MIRFGVSQVGIALLYLGLASLVGFSGVMGIGNAIGAVVLLGVAVEAFAFSFTGGMSRFSVERLLGRRINRPQPSHSFLPAGVTFRFGFMFFVSALVSYATLVASEDAAQRALVGVAVILKLLNGLEQLFYGFTNGLYNLPLLFTRPEDLPNTGNQSNGSEGSTAEAERDQQEDGQADDDDENKGQT